MHLVPRLWRGGMEHNVVKLCNATNRGLISNSICSCLPADHLKDQLASDVRLFEYNRRDGNDVRLVGGLVRLFRREAPDIVHSHAWGTLCEGYAAARLARVPVLIHGEHGTMRLAWRNRVAQRLVWNRVDHLLAVSRTLASAMANQVGIDESRVRVIYNGVDLARFERGIRGRLRAELGLSEGEVLVVTVGRLEPVKDHRLLIDALAVIAREIPHFRAALAGEGGLRAELERQIRSRGLGERVHLLGQRNDVEDVLAAADLFVLSSRSEGLPNGIMEAMAAGRAVVSTAVGGATELVVHEGTGLLVSNRSPTALAEALAALIRGDERRRAFGLAGRRRAHDLFGFDRMVHDYESLYLSAAYETRRLRSAFSDN